MSLPPRGGGAQLPKHLHWRGFLWCVCMCRYTQAWCTCMRRSENKLRVNLQGSCTLFETVCQWPETSPRSQACLFAKLPAACPHLPLAITQADHATMSGTHLGSVFQEILAHRGREDMVAGMGQSLGVRPYSNASSHEINQKAPRQGDQKQ